jgi:VWFA-related protein
MNARPGWVAVLLAVLPVAVARLPPHSAGTTAQQPPPPRQQQQVPPPDPQIPIFRSGTDVVPITVQVIDQKGVPVTDLTQKDFRIYEDDRLREIVGFYPQMMAPGPVVPPALVWDQRNSARLSATTRRTFLLVLGYGRIQHPTKALDGAMKFVRTMLLPQDAVAVIAFNRATAFTTDHEAIAQVLERFKKEHERLFWEVREHYFRTRVPYRLRTPLDIEADLGLNGGGTTLPAKILDDIDRSLFEGVLPKAALHSTADVLLGMDLAPPTGQKHWQHQYQFEELLNALQALGLTLSDAVMQSSPLKLFAGIEHLRYMDGEKHLVYLGGNPPIARDADLAKIFAARANDARVVVDFIWTAGLGGRGPAGCTPCRDIVEYTGGTYATIDMAEVALAKVDRRTRASYLIGYTPANPALDGKYRQVRVEVDRRNVTVQYRHGYFASEEPPPFELKERVAAKRTSAALSFDENATGLDVQAAVEMEQRAGTQTARVDLILDIGPVSFNDDGALKVGELQVAVYCGDAKEKVIAESKVRWILRASDDILADWLKDGIQRSLRVPVKVKPKFVKVVVYDPGSDRTGSISLAVK